MEKLRRIREEYKKLSRTASKEIAELAKNYTYGQANPHTKTDKMYSEMLSGLAKDENLICQKYGLIP